MKLYYPEQDSARVVAAIRAKPVCYSPLHELELVNALQLKVFLKSATTAQVRAARALVESDLKSGVLVWVGGDWKEIIEEAVRLAVQHTDKLGCRSLDILHCAAAKVLGVSEFITTDERQKKLALAMGLKLLDI